MFVQVSGRRSIAVDVARLVAAAAVVWIHVTSCEESRASLPLCRFAVPFFTAAVVYFILARAARPQCPALLTYCAQRVQRLYLPFLLWSAFYLALRLSKHAAVHEGSAIVFSPAMLLTGSTHHLWFLPFAAIISVGMFAIARAVRPWGETRRAILAGSSVIIALVLAFGPIPSATTNGTPVAYFLDHAWRALPSVFLGAAVYWLTRRGAPQGFRYAVLAIGVMFALAELTPLESPIGPHLAGASLLYFTSTQPNRAWMTTGWNWAEIAFLVYLSHVAFIEVLKTVANRFGDGPSVVSDLTVWALSFALSVIVAHYTLELRAFRRRSRASIDPAPAGIA